MQICYCRPPKVIREPGREPHCDKCGHWWTMKHGSFAEDSKPAPPKSHPPSYPPVTRARLRFRNSTVKHHPHFFDRSPEDRIALAAAEVRRQERAAKRAVNEEKSRRANPLHR